MLALAIPNLSKTLLPRVVRMFARTLTRFGTEWDSDSKCALPIDNIEHAVHGLSLVDGDLYARDLAARAIVRDALPHLCRWVELATERLLECPWRSALFNAVRSRVLRCVRAAVRVFSSLRRCGCAYLRETKAYHWGFDLWLRLRGCTTDEEGTLGVLLLTCRREFDRANMRRDVPFADYLTERVSSQFHLTLSDVVALAVKRFRRSRTHIPTNTDDLKGGAHVGIALHVLSTALGLSDAMCMSVVRRSCVRDVMKSMTWSINPALSPSVLGLAIHVLARICIRTRSPRALRIALKWGLVPCLMAATQRYATLEIEAQAALSMLVSTMLPDALVFHSVFKRCAALATEHGRREALRTVPALKDEWEHLFRVYDSGKAYCDASLARPLRTCGNVSPTIACAQ